jgi:hypothetical protein
MWELAIGCEEGGGVGVDAREGVALSPSWVGV